MPPPVEDLSDEENGDIPFNDAKENQADGAQSDADEDDDEEEGVYIVEEIINHTWADDGSLALHVKWKGYEKLEDHTWEPEEGLKEGAEDVLAAYYKKIGGRPKKPAAKPGPKAGPGRKRKSAGDSQATTPSAAAPTETKKRRKSSPKPTQASETPALTEDDSAEESNWVPKGKNWENQVETVDTIARDPNDSGLYAFLLWTNGKRSRVAIESCYEKCPRKVSSVHLCDAESLYADMQNQMLKFYESHLVFKEAEA